MTQNTLLVKQIKERCDGKLNILLQLVTHKDVLYKILRTNEYYTLTNGSMDTIHCKILKG